MILLRKLAAMLAIGIATFALSSTAVLGAEKQYVLTVASSPATPAPAYQFTFTNDGNSSFNSLTLSLPAGWTLSMAGGASASRGVTSVNTARNLVTVSNINLPTGAGQFMTVTVTGVTGTASCGAQSGDWTAQPWTGSSVGSGQKFNPKPSSTYPVQTTLAASCYTVTSSTSDALKGDIAPSGPQSVSAGTSAAFTITPTSAYDIGTTGGNCGGTLTGNIFTTAPVNANCTVIANFNLKTFTVTPSAGAGGTMSPSMPQTVGFNQTTAFTVTPNTGFHATSVASGCGGSLSGTTFTTGPVTSNCTVTASFVANTLTVVAPDQVYITTPFNVAVTRDGPPATIGITSNCSFAVTSTSTVGNTTTFTGTIPAVPTTGSCTLTVAAPPEYGSQQKTVSVYSGLLGCSPSTSTGGDLIPGNGVTYVKASDQGKWGLVRGNNKDSTGCVAVPYIFDLNITSSPQVASFIVPDPAVTPFQKVAAEYVVVWGRVAVDASGDASSWTTKRPKLSWGTSVAPVPGTDDYVPALACVLDPDNPDLSATYPNGFRSVLTAQLESLLPVIPNVAPFNALPADAKYDRYRPGEKAKMCIAQQGWTAVGKDSAGKTLIQYWTRVIDQADGFMSLDN